MIYLIVKRLQDLNTKRNGNFFLATTVASILSSLKMFAVIYLFFRFNLQYVY